MMDDHWLKNSCIGYSVYCYPDGLLFPSLYYLTLHSVFLFCGWDLFYALQIINLTFITAEAISVESTTVWETNDKTFEKWICPLVYSLIGHSNDVILRFFVIFFSSFVVAC